jgi:cystathionine beta-lyase/cystathionine gamma-synthase
MHISTKFIHAGQEPDAETGAIMPPIYMTSTYIQEAPGVSKGYDYTRAGNPNFTILEDLIASIENGKFATVFSSGMGALTSLVSSLETGDSVLALQGVYGGTYRLFTQVFNRFGIKFSQVPFEELEEALKEKPKFLIFETPTNPLLNIYDIKTAVRLAHKEGVEVIVDNTFATPYCQNPLDLGADAVWHSTTKYMGGHSDVVGGVMITNDIRLKEKLDFGRKALGLNPSPFDTWLVTRGIKTLGARMALHTQNALHIARFLEQHPLVKKVYYPGLETHPGHKIAKNQMRSFSGMVSAEFNLTLEQTKKLIASFKLFALAESLGGVESLVCHPATMTHASIPPNVRHSIGLGDGLVRFSVGIEDKLDLEHDLKQALENL